MCYLKKSDLINQDNETKVLSQENGSKNVSSIFDHLKNNFRFDVRGGTPFQMLLLW